MGMIGAILGAIALAAIVQSADAAATERTPQQTAGQYEPTPYSIVDRMLELARVGPGDVVVDLGSGDGRLVIAAAKQRGATGFGVDIDGGLVQLANENARREGVAHRVSFRREDLFSTDIRGATVVTLYLLPDTVPKLLPKLLGELAPGSRVVSHDYPLLPWSPSAKEQLDVPEKVAINGTSETILFLYVVPARVTGTWRARFPENISVEPVRLVFTQTPRRTRGASTVNGRTVTLTDLTLDGANIAFSMLVASGKTVKVRGVVDGNEMRGTVETADGERPWEANLKP